MRVECIEDFIEPDNVEEILPKDGIVIDCIDNVRAKAAMINTALKRGQTIITCGRPEDAKDPLRIKIDDLALTKGDPLYPASELSSPEKNTPSQRKVFRKSHEI